MDDSEQQQIVLVSSDGKRFELSQKAASLSKMLSTMLQDLNGGGDFPSEGIPISQIDGETLEKIITYMMHHQDDDAEAEAENTDSDSDDSDSEDPSEHPTLANQNISEWDAAFLPSTIEQKDSLFKLLNAANFLDIKGLLDIGCKFVSDELAGKTVEYMRDYLNQENDYTEEEMNQLKEELSWALEDD